MMRCSIGRAVLHACAVLLASASLRAQEVETMCVAADSASAAVQRAAYANTALAAEPDAALARYVCARDAASFAVALPAGWDVEVPEDGTWLMAAASLRAPRFVVIGDDLLPEPATESDSAGFWQYATALVQAGDPLDEEIAAFQRLVRDRAGARAAVTRAMGDDARLRGVARILSVEDEGGVVRDSASELRTLAGRPAGYLRESYEDDGQPWHRETYATVHEARIYAVSFSAPEADFRRLQPLWRRVVDSVALETALPEAPSASP